MGKQLLDALVVFVKTRLRCKTLLYHIRAATQSHHTGMHTGDHKHEHKPIAGHAIANPWSVDIGRAENCECLFQIIKVSQLNVTIVYAYNGYGCSMV